MASFLVFLCWDVWAVVWILGAFASWRSGPKTLRGNFGWPVWLLALAAFALYGASPGIEPLIRPPHPLLSAVGVVVLAGSTAFTLWARSVLGLMWSSSPSVKQGHELRTDGPYAVTRHPIYTGMLGMLLGTAVALGLGWSLVLFLVAIVIFALKARTEEQLMMATFGDDYKDYRRRTPQLVPRWPTRR